MMEYELFFIILLSTIFRVLFWICKNTDDYSHLWMILSRKKIKNPFDHSVDNSVVQGKRGYPILHHYIISLFPRNLWIIIGKTLNIFYDLLVIIFLYFILNKFFYNFKVLSFTLGFWGSLLLGTMPILLPTNSRVQAMGARTLGFLFFSIYFLMFYKFFCLKSYSIEIFFSMLLLHLLIIMSSTMALQCIIFFNFFMSLFLLNILPFVITLISIGLCFLMPKLGLLDTLKFIKSHLTWYRKNLEGTGVEFRNKIEDVVKLPFYFWKNRKKFIYVVFYNNSFIISLINFPMFYLVLFIAIEKRLFNSSFEIFMFKVFMCFFLMFLLTSVKPFLFLGQAERYFEYVSPAVVFYFLFLISKSLIPEKFIIFFLLLNIITVIINYLVANREVLEKNLKLITDDSYENLVDYLKEKGRLDILTIPIKFSFRLAADLENCNFYYRFINQGKKGMKYFEKDTQSLELPKPNWSYFKKEYGIDTIVLNKRFLKFFKENDFKGLEKEFENKDYIVMRIR